MLIDDFRKYKHLFETTGFPIIAKFQEVLQFFISVDTINVLQIQFMYLTA